MKRHEIIFKICYRATNKAGQFAEVQPLSRCANDTLLFLEEHTITRSLPYLYSLGKGMRLIDLPGEPTLNPEDRKAIAALDKLGDPLSWAIQIEQIIY